MRNLRYAARMLARSPGFAIMAILTLALGIGANTAIFSVANALLLRPLPYAYPERLVLVYLTKAGAPRELQPFSLPRATFIADKSRAFREFAEFTNETFNLTGRGDPEQLRAARVSWNFFDVLGVRPELGRTFVADEDQPGGKAVCLISYGLWRRSFGARADILGQNITLDATPNTIIGVLPRGFQFAPLGAGVDLWAAKLYNLNLVTPEAVRAGVGFLTAVARLAPGVSVGQADAEMAILSDQYRRENPRMPDADPSRSIRASDLQQQTVANVRTAVEILCGAVSLLLLIACANVAALLLSRALGRRKEIAVRAALGAGRGSLIGQLLIESVLLALVGGVLGIGLSAWGTRALAALGQGSLPRVEEIGIDWRVLGFTAALSVLTGVLFGLFPAIELTRQDLNAVLRAEGRGSAGSRGRSRSRSTLVIAQVALSMVLLIGDGLLIRSFVKLRNVNAGFDPRHVLTMNIALPPARYPKGPQMAAFYDRLVKRVAAMPGVRSAAVCSALPVEPVRFSPVLVEGQPEVPLAARPIFAIQMVSPAYFRTLGIALRRGRGFGDGDTAEAPLVAVVNETLARRYWPRENPIGKHLLLGRMVKPTEVVGVAADVNNLSLAAAPEPEVYLSFPQRPWASMNLILRAAGDPNNWVGAARAAVAGSAGNCSEDHGRSAGHIHGATALQCAAAGGVLDCGAPAGGGGSVWRDRLLCGRTDPGDGHPHCAGRRAGRYSPHGRESGSVAGVVRPGDRRHRRAGFHANDVGIAVSYRRRRSTQLRRECAAVRGHRRAGQLCAGPPRHASRSNRSATIRIVACSGYSKSRSKRSSGKIRPRGA